MEVIIFPEIQLQDFVKNKELTNTEYVAVRLTDYKPFYAKVKKIPDMITNINDIPHTIVQVNYNKIPSAFVRFVYYFDPNGIASKKEAYFFGAKSNKTIVGNINDKKNSSLFFCFITIILCY